jgi:hypothetical protein
MIDIGKILKRAWHILWDYKVLWIFGFLLALTIGNGGGVRSSSSYQYGQRDINNYNPNYQTGPYWNEFNSWMQRYVMPVVTHPERYIGTFIWIGVIILTVILVFAAINALIRYPSETAVLRMVNDYEQNGTRVGFRQGWKLGWSRSAFRIWLVDLILGIPGFIFAMIVLGMVGVLIYNIYLGRLMMYDIPSALFGIFGGIFCLLLPLALVLALLGVFLNVLRQFITRKIALEGLTFGESFREGWVMFKRNLGGAALMWLVMLGIGIGVGVAMIIALIVLIPAYIVTAIVGVMVAAIPGLAAFGIASLFGGKLLAILIGILVALPFFVTILASPNTFLGGLVQIYSSSVWTLTYREMKSRETVTQAEPAPVVQPAQ